MSRLPLVLLQVAIFVLAGCGGKNKGVAVVNTALRQNAKSEPSRPPEEKLPQEAAPQAENGKTLIAPADEVVAAVEAMGGIVIRDTEKPGQPVAMINFFRPPNLDTNVRLATKSGGTVSAALVSDKDLERLANLKLPELEVLGLSGVKVTDAGLVHLRKFPKLGFLTLNGSAFTDRGFEEATKLDNLFSLSFASTSLTDKGLAHRGKLPRIYELHLSWNKGITDAGLAELKGLDSLFHLDLSGTNITDAGLVHLKGLKSLGDLDLTSTKITDAGLVHLAAFTKLGSLSLSRTRVTDAGLLHLVGMRNLRGLHLGETPVTLGAIKQLQKQLPDLQNLSHSPIPNYREPEVTAPTSKQADRLSEVISWLPTDTETATVARGPFTVGDANFATGQSAAAALQQTFTQPLLAGLQNGKYASDLEGAQVGLVVEGARRFRQPTALGGFLFEGCRISIFEDDFAKKGDALFEKVFRDAKVTEEIASHKVAQFQEQFEQDTVTMYVARIAPNILVEATDRAYLVEVLTRMRRKDTPRPALLDSPAWKKLDPGARYWMIRTYAKTPGDDITSPYFAGSRTADPKAKAIAFSFPKAATKSPTMIYFSENDDAESIVKKSWGEKVKVQRLEAGVIEISFPIANTQNLWEFVGLLLWHFGHGIYV